MKRSIKSSFGVTLLEIMLVLVIASLVLVMSIRYYQSATNSQRVNAAVNIVTGIVAAADTYQSSTGSFSNMTSDSIAPYMPNSTMPNSPWGAAPIGIAGAAGLTYTITISLLPSGVCSQIAILVKTNTKIGATCSTGQIAVTYDSSK